MNDIINQPSPSDVKFDLFRSRMLRSRHVLGVATAAGSDAGVTHPRAALAASLIAKALQALEYEEMSANIGALRVIAHRRLDPDGNEIVIAVCYTAGSPISKTIQRSMRQAFRAIWGRS